jgi:Tol biopolymer transport system component
MFRIKFPQILLFYFIFIVFSSNCSTFISKKYKIKDVEFDYEVISKNYFSPGNEKPFPLTVQKGNNLFSSTSQDGRFLYYSSNSKGNYDLYIRDLKSSTVLSLTEHPSAEYKPTISPDGKYLVYVSEEDDSNGDLVQCELNSSEIFKDHFSGKSKAQLAKRNLTNPKGGDTFYDTDPSYSPDGNFIVFSSNRLSPNIQNIVLMDLKNPESIFKISDSGGSHPSYSRDGKKIIYVSYKYNKNGDIAIIYLDSGEEKYMTKDLYPDFSPSFGSDSESIYFTSIREDSNGDKKINEKDISRILTKKIDSSDKEFFLTPSDYSSFDSKFSNFNGGSILYSASIFNSINIYFFPLTGMIPKKATPAEQFKIIQEYLNSEKESIVQLALDSMYLYFSDHPLFLIYQAKTDILKIQYLWNKRKENALKAEIEKIEKDRSEDISFLYKKILYLNLKHKLTGQSNNKEVERLKIVYENIKDNSVLYAAFLEAYAESKILQREVPAAVVTFNKIILSFPEYYNLTYIKLKMGDLVFTPNSIKIPEVYMNLIDEPILLEDKIKALIDIEENIKFSKNPKEKIEYCEKLIKENNLPERSKELFKLITYIKAESLSESRFFQESIDLLNSIIDPIPVIDPVCAFTPGCKQKLPCEGDRVCSQTHLLKAINLENLGNYNGFFEEIKIYLQGFDPDLKVFVEKGEIEKNFRYFELKAKEYESMGMLKESALNFFYNTENMYLLKEKNLFVNSIYTHFGNYYYKKMVDYIMKYARQQAKEERDSIFNKINIIGNENLDLLGKYNQFLSVIPKNRITGFVIENLKIDVSNEIVLGKPGTNEDALKLIEQHFNLSRPRSRPILYLASLYGYAYFQIQKAIELDEFYRSKNSLTPNKKEKILEGFKIAESELKWILFADQEFIDAYLLLGYLYQYIDLSKREILGDTTEGDEFYESYNRYFPGNNLEKNVDLYKQILTFIGENKNKKYISDIQLNLGNTYLYLNNYSKANESYKQVSILSNFILDDVQFSDPQQKALFHFNFSKSLLYNNEFKRADSELNLLLNIYTNSPTLTANKDLYNQKLTLIYTLKGHVNSELKNHNEAIHNFSKALSFNNNYIPNLSLYNSLGYNYIQKNELKEANKMIILAKDEYSNNKDSNEYLKQFDLWSIILPEKLRTIGEGKLSKYLPSRLQYLWITGNELLLHSINYDENKLLEVISKREKFITSNNLYKYNIDPNILLFDKSLLANIYYQNQKYLLSSQLYKELYQESKNWEFLKYTSYSILRKEPTLDENNFIELQLLIDEFKKYKEIYITNCTIQNSSIEINICTSDFYKENKEYDLILNNIYFSLTNLLNNNIVLSLYYNSLLEDSNSKIEISKNDLAFGKIDKVRILLNQLNHTSSYDRYEEKLREIDYYVKEYNLKEEEFLLSIIQLKYYLNSNDLNKIKKVLESSEESFNYNLFSMVVPLESLLEYLDLNIQYHFLNKSYYLIPNLEEKKLWVKVIKTFFRYTLDFRVAATQKQYELLKNTYDSFNNQVNFSRNQFNKYSTPIITNDLRKNLEKIEIELENFISKNKRFSYLKFSKISNTQLKNNIFLSKVYNNYLLFTFHNNQSEVKILIDSEFDILKESIAKNNQLNSLIIYLNISELNSSLENIINISNTINFLSYQDLIYSKKFSWIKSHEQQFQNISSDNLYHQNLLQLQFSEGNFSDWFLKTSNNTSIKQLIENDLLIPSTEIDAGSIDTSILGLFMKMSNFQLITFKSSKNKIFFGYNLSSNENFEESIHTALKKEHKNDFKAGIQILKSIDRFSLENHQKLKLDLILARLYSKEFKNNSYHSFYQHILKIYPSKEDSIVIKLEEIKFCYFSNSPDCYKLSSTLKTILNKSNFNFDVKVKVINKINYYENYSGHLYQSIYKNHIEMDEIESTEDEFLFLSNKFQFFFYHYYPEEALFFLNQLYSLEKDNEEWEVYRTFEKEFYLVSNLSGNTSDLKVTFENNIYSSILNRDYNKILILANSESKIDTLEIFKVNLYRTFLSLEIGENFSISNLFDSKLISGDSLYSQLEIKDKLILFYIFSKSILDQKENEITNMVFKLLKSENKISPKLSSQLLMTYSENALNRGDLTTTKQVIDFLYLNYQNHLLEKSIKTRFETLNFKFDYLKSNIMNLNPSNEYLELFLKIKENPRNSYVYLNTFLKLKNESTFTSFHKRELIDLISMVQKLSLEIDSTSLFYDFSIFKDKLSVYNERFFPNDIKIKELPTIVQISSDLIRKTPIGQSVISVFPIGGDLIKIKISDNKIIGKIYPNENLKLRNDTFIYYKTIANSGSAPILKETLEIKLRKIILLEKKKRTYLYLSSYLIKVPIEFKEEDNFYFIHNPEHLIKNLPMIYHTIFKSDFKVNIQSSKNYSNSYLKKLELLEVGTHQNNSNNQITYLSKKIHLKNKKVITIDDQDVTDYRLANSTNGILLLAGSDLFKTSFLKDDQISLIQLFEESHKGIIIYSLTPQFNETDPILFYKEFLNFYDYNVNLKSRYVNSIKTLKNLDKKEITYIGYRMGVNCFLLD